MVGVFEQVVSQLPLIMSFQSLILDMAGNVGTQSLAVTIRVLMDENLTAPSEIRSGGQRDADRICKRASPRGGLLRSHWPFHLGGQGQGLWASFAISGCIASRCCWPW